MILVKSAEICRTEYDEVKIVKNTSSEEILYPGDTPSRSDAYNIEEESVKGQTFVNEKGEWVTIGWSSEVQEALSLPFKCFRDQKDRIQSLESACSELGKRNRALVNSYYKLQNKSFFQRLKWAFRPY